MNHSSARSRGQPSADYGYGRAPRNQTHQKAPPESDPHHLPAVPLPRTAARLSQTDALKGYSALLDLFGSAPVPPSRHLPWTESPPRVPAGHGVRLTGAETEEDESTPFHMHPVTRTFLFFHHIPSTNRFRSSPSDSTQMPAAPPSHDCR